MSTKTDPQPKTVASPEQGLASPRCSASELLRRIELNVAAIGTTAKIIGELSTHGDTTFAKKELANLQSQVGGLAEMLNSKG